LNNGHSGGGDSGNIRTQYRLDRLGGYDIGHVDICTCYIPKCHYRGILLPLVESAGQSQRGEDIREVVEEELQDESEEDGYGEAVVEPGDVGLSGRHLTADTDKDTNRGEKRRKKGVRSEYLHNIKVEILDLK